MRPHLGGDIVDAESCGGRVRENAGDERAQLTTVMVRRVSLLGRGDDERADAAAGLDHAGALADGGELIAGVEASGGDGRAKPAIELRVNRGAVPRVDGNERPGCHLS